ncbi:tRNA (adenosine(37)-N6)-threonylcarbamoyltransferase complex ATPase subunit type 1 TsaE [Persephonella sp.]|uniref:tRNA (adenosine(37)-N6)-threonylcarbamoyltransferase complex ATPase subunit type 1 TsaE n=1 Tax=Persephonella sp. TaxID=2060922 RepID=UPI0025EED537|nr:tRNA (adenosine(37)-N6)-threonylcarbamoyltransferase complex ATPase subunit type 1 TsaE [Persephonella sp.]
MKLTKKINSINQLKNFALNLSKCLKGNEIILLKGNLAAGKTTFTRFLVSAIDPEAEDQVSSPTFSVMNEYETSRFPVYHIDLYRVKDFDFSDVLGHGLVLVEWAEKVSDFGDYPVIFIDISIVDENKRIFKIETRNADYLNECLK